MKKSFLIQPFTATIKEVECDYELDTICDLLGIDCFALLEVSIGDLYVDDNGMFNERSLEKGCFRVKGIHQRLIGDGLLHVNDMFTLSDVKRAIIFL